MIDEPLSEGTGLLKKMAAEMVMNNVVGPSMVGTEKAELELPEPRSVFDLFICTMKFT